MNRSTLLKYPLSEPSSPLAGLGLFLAWTGISGGLVNAASLLASTSQAGGDTPSGKCPFVRAKDDEAKIPIIAIAKAREAINTLIGISYLLTDRPFHGRLAFVNRTLTFSCDIARAVSRVCGDPFPHSEEMRVLPDVRVAGLQGIGECASALCIESSEPMPCKSADRAGPGNKVVFELGALLPGEMASERAWITQKFQNKVHLPIGGEGDQQLQTARDRSAPPTLPTDSA